MKRPSSSRTTATKNYFELREAKENEEAENDIPSPFLLRQQSADDNAGPLFRLIADDDGEFFSYGWNTSTALKPRDEFVDEMMSSLTGIDFIDRYFTGRSRKEEKSEMLCLPDAGASVSEEEVKESQNESIEKDINIASAHWTVEQLLLTLYRFSGYLCSGFSLSKLNIVRLAGNLKRVIIERTQQIRRRNDDKDVCDAEEDGLFVEPATTTSHLNSLSRLEARMRREVSRANNSRNHVYTEHESGVDNDTNRDSAEKIDSTPARIVPSAKTDESFWLSPGHQQFAANNRDDSSKEFQLTIHIERIKFSQHQEFTPEELVLCNISTLYGRYKERIEAESFQYYVTRLLSIFQHLRTIVKCHEESRMNEDHSHSNSLEKVLDDLRTTSRNLVEESDEIRDLSTRLQEHWKELLLARENEGFASTDVIIETASISDDEFEKDASRLEGELTSINATLSQFDESKFPSVEYQSILEDVKRVIHDSEHIHKVMKLGRSNNSQTEWLPKEEKTRRQRLQSEKYFGRLLVNGNVIGDTKATCLEWPTFSVLVNHRFQCTLSETPSDLCIQIWKASFDFLPPSLVSSCFIDVPQCRYEFSNKNSCTSTDVKVEWYQFSSRKSFGSGRTRKCQLKGAVLIASNLSVKLATDHPQTTTATNFHRQHSTTLFKAKRLIKNPAALTNSSSGIGAHRNKCVRYSQYQHFLTDRQAMMEFKFTSTGSLFKNKLGICEPDRQSLIKKRHYGDISVPSPIPASELLVQKSAIHIDLIGKDEETNQKEMVDSAKKERPAVDREQIAKFLRHVHQQSVLNERNTVKRKSHSAIVQDVGLYRFASNDPITLCIPPRKRSLFPTIVQRMPTRHKTNQCSLLLTLVSGKNVPLKDEGDNQGVLSNINNTDQYDTSNDALERNGSGSLGTLFAPLLDHVDQEHLGVKVKIKFRGRQYQTKTVVGSRSPLWKETLVVSLDDVFQETSLCLPACLENEMIDIVVFDCIDIDLRHKGGFYDDEETKILENRYLGSTSIPLGTILREGHIDGFVRCITPDVIVGYGSNLQNANELSNANGEEGTKEGESTHLSLFETTRHEMKSSAMHLRFFATTDPFHTLPPKCFPEYPSNEDEFLMSRVKQWLQNLNRNEFQKSEHECPILWPDSHGYAWLATRFLTEQNPPSGFETLSSCAHYVSLVPSLKDWIALHPSNQEDSTRLTSQQCINIQAGNVEEHGVLLANFFLYLSKKSPDAYRADVYLALGFGIPEGKTVYVIRRCRKSGDIQFWDATKAAVYSFDDDSCPLQKIFCIVSKKNVYANLQRDKIPSQLDFNLSNQRRWAPLHTETETYSPHHSKKLIPIQEDRLNYSPPNHYYARELGNELRETIKNSIRQWRRGATSFRTDLGSKVTLILEKLEQAKLGEVVGYETSAIMVLPENITKTRTVFGLPLHIAFTNVKNVLDRVQETEIHRNKDPHVEFALGVKVFPYPGGILSVWVFLCSLVPSS